MLTIMNRFQRWLARNEWTGPDLYEFATPRRAVIVLDTSDSMQHKDFAPSRIEVAQSAGREFVAQVAQNEPGALIAIIGYSDRAEIACGFCPVSNSRKINAAIDGLVAGGSTNLTAGARAARNVIEDAGEHGAQVIVLSDGHHCEGRGPESEGRWLRQRAVVECIGIGGDPAAVNEDLLRSLASIKRDGTKRYRWIGDGALLVEHYRQLAGRITR